MFKKFLFLIFVLIAPLVAIGQDAVPAVDTFQTAFNIIIDFCGAKWSVVLLVVGGLALLREIILLIIGAVESYVISTADKKDDEEFAKFKNNKWTKLFLYLLGLCDGYKKHKKV